jgi:hypothetical protein
MNVKDYNFENGIIVSHKELKEDVNVASSKFRERDFCFTWITVKALMDRVEQLQVELNNK